MLKNNNGFFEDVTNDILPPLKPFGIIKDANWTDINNDGRKDLILVGEYSPITVFVNKKNGFERLKSKILDNSYGLWRCIEATDLDNDGDLDFLLGNFGKNNMLSISPETPLFISTRDVDKNGSIDPLIFNAQQEQLWRLGFVSCTILG